MPSRKIWIILCSGAATVPSATGNVVQNIGYATSATSVNFQSQLPIVLA